MSKILKAADEAKKLTKMFQALGEVAEVLDRFGSIEQAENEAKVRIEKMNKESEAIVAKVNAASVEAQEIVAAAKVKADEIVGEAEVAAQNVAEAAKTQADAAMANAKSVTDAAVESLAAIRADTDAEIAKRDAALDEVVELEKRAEKARAYLAKLAG